MKWNLLLVSFAIVLSGSVQTLLGQGDPATCCSDCTCTLCGDQLSCGFLLPSDCDLGGDNRCGIGGDSLCTYIWQNSHLYPAGVPRGDGASDNCIPIDEGLGFLIAGGLGIGVIGIRRRSSRVELDCA